jgi:hypothetical protein
MFDRYTKADRWLALFLVIGGSITGIAFGKFVLIQLGEW